MKIVLFHQTFSTPNGAWSTRPYDLSKYWVERGCDVTVVTSASIKSDIKSTKLLETRFIDGVRLKIINAVEDNKKPKFKRVLTYLQYTLYSCWYALTLPADIMIMSSGPITIGFAALLARYIRGKKVVFEVRDIWPEIAIVMGYLNNKLQQRFFYYLEKKCYSAANLIVVLSPGMKQNIQKRFGHKKIVVIPNSSNNELFNEETKFDLPKFFKESRVAIYPGNIGPINQPDLLLETAKILQQRNQKDITILLIGDGIQKKQIIEQAIKNNLDNFVVLDSIPKKYLFKYIQSAMITFVILKKDPILETSCPNKFFDSLAVGTPIINNTNGWMKTTLEEFQCGFTVYDNNPVEIANILERIILNDELNDLMRNNAKYLATTKFDKKYLAQKYYDYLLSVVDSKEMMYED